MHDAEIRVLFKDTKPIEIMCVGKTHTACLNIKYRNVRIYDNWGKTIWSKFGVDRFELIEIPDEVLEKSGLVNDFPDKFGYGDLDPDN